ncbi:hypothetical protein OSB04_021867, partial [Centaurea solstitialis]
MAREEIEALRFVGKEEQNKKWAEVYYVLSPYVAKEYATLWVDTDNLQPQSMPSILPLCSSSNNRKFVQYGRGFK